MAPKRETALQKWGKELAFAREAARMTGKELAEGAYVGHSTIGMWETGRRTPNLDDLARCERLLGTNGYLGRLLGEWVSEEISPEWLEWIRVEQQAIMILWFELSVIPGLLQTEAYARAVLQYARHAPMEKDAWKSPARPSVRSPPATARILQGAR